MREIMKEIQMWTDGSALKAPDGKFFSGAGCVLIYKDIVKEISTPLGFGTNNTAELSAPLIGLRLLKEKCNVTIHSDSQYTIDCITKYYKSWEKNGFITQSKKEVKNKEIIKELYTETQKHHVTWVKVKAHCGIEYNEAADRLACQGSELSKQEMSL